MIREWGYHRTRALGRRLAQLAQRAERAEGEHGSDGGGGGGDDEDDDDNDDGGGDVVEEEEEVNAGEGGCASTAADPSMTGALISVLVGEPSFHCCAGRASLNALLFYHRVRSLRPLMHPQGCAVVPRRARLWAIGVCFGELRAAHGTLGTSACGIDHAPLDQCWDGWWARPYVYHLWQYAHEIVSAEPVLMMTLDYDEAAREKNGGGEGGESGERGKGNGQGLHSLLDPATARRDVCMTLRHGAAAIDAVALAVEDDLSDPASRGVGDATYSGHEVFFLPSRREGDRPLHMQVSAERGALHIEFMGLHT